jgi:hypothetical protein
MTFLEYRTDSGLIVNAIVYDGQDDYTPPEGMSLIERGVSEAWIGWTYVDGKFTPPSEPEE